ncbi:MAG: FecR domain-containing protein [bacterium]|nr:FecR domain-containing protein [bacterium]
MKKTFFFSMPSLYTPGLIVPLLILCGFFTAANAQEPSATISSMNGTVLVTIQGQEAIAATIGTTLQTGDFLETESGASVVLTLTEGSELKIGQNTKIDIAQLARRPKTKARTSHVKLLYGKFRAFLSPGHQEEGATFDIETPNAMAGVKFSLPEVFISYDPNTETTIIDAVTVEVIVRNLITREIKRLPSGYRAIIQGDTITQGDTIIQEDTIDIFPISETALSSRYHNFFLGSRSIIKGITAGSVPNSVGSWGDGAGGAGGATTSTNPSPGGRPRRDPISRTFTIHVGEDFFQ